MPASAPAPICGKNWWLNCSHCQHRLVLLCAIMVGAAALLAGCDDEPADHIPIEHAEVRGAFHGEMTVWHAQEWTLLHPSSDRQRQSRKNLLYLQELDDQIIDDETTVDEPGDDGPGQLQPNIIDDMPEEAP